MNTKRNLEYWVIPPEADTEFAAHMEDVLDVYSRPYDANVPVLCMDEQPVQLVEEVREPIAATIEHPKRVDYEYKRAGVANIFMFAEPLANWRHVSVRARKTKEDCGHWRWGAVGRALQRLRESDRRLRQSQHAYDGRVLQGVRPCPCAVDREPHRVSLHPEARQLAEHRRVRTELRDQSVCHWSPDW